jgi:isopenicillin N synthase-like dioxygenase
MDSIPVVDIAPFAEGGARDREAVARQVDSACSSLGFLIISGHGVADRLIDDMRGASLAYFDRPLEEKLKLRMPPDRYRGYIALGSEALSYSLDQESPPDFKESFSIGPVDFPDDDYTVPRRRESSSPPTCGRNLCATFGRSGRPTTARWSAWRRR